MAGLILRNAVDTACLGRAIATLIKKLNPGCLLLKGELGAGKTALVNAIVRALPGGDDAEPSSPSFTICNIYCTAPVVHHFDLYRLPPGSMFDALAESFDDRTTLTIVEWPEHMAVEDAPHDGLTLVFKPGSSNTERVLEFASIGHAGHFFLTMLTKVDIADYKT